MRFFARPEFLARMHAVGTVLWFLNFPLVFVLPMRLLAAYIAFCSVYANFVGHFSSWQAVRTELKQDEMLRNLQERKL
jgi:hypothetical protein